MRAMPICRPMCRSCISRRSASRRSSRAWSIWRYSFACLSRSALGSPITQYTSHFRGPRRGGEMHVVLVDNGRSERLGMEEFWTSLKCIRCGACMNTCPVYRRSGGLSYGATYSGPIGLIIDPTFNARKYSNLPFASSLNGSCSNVCPVKINIHEQIYAWRRVLVERHEMPLAKKAAMKAAGALLSRPAAYRAAIAAADIALAHLPRFVIYNGLNAWGKHREMPHPPKQTFHSWYRDEPRRRSNEQPRRDPGLDPRQSATARPAASLRSRVRRRPAGLAAGRLQGRTCMRMGGMFLDPPVVGDSAGAGSGEDRGRRKSCARSCRRSPATAISPASARRGISRMWISRSSAPPSPSPRPAPCC